MGQRPVPAGRAHDRGPLRTRPPCSPHPQPGSADALRPPARLGRHDRREAQLIPKVHERSPIRSLRWLLPYLFGPGKNDERGGIHHNPRLVAAWAYATAGNLADLQPPSTADGRTSVRRLTELLEQPARICWNVPALPVWHCSIHNHLDDPVLTDQQWGHVATEIVAATGLAPHGDLSAVRWIAIRHAEGHIHIVANLVRQDRRAVWAWQDYRGAQACCRQLERRYGLHRVGTQPATQRHPKPAELNKTTRQHRDHVPRTQLRGLVRTAAEAALNEHDFLGRLRRCGILVRPRTDRSNPTNITGYAVALPDDRNAAGDTIWYSGRSLAVQLSLPNLRHHWRSP